MGAARRSSLGLSAAVLLAVAAALTSFTVLLDEGLWGPTVLVVSAAAIAAGSLVRSSVRRWLPLWSLAASALAAVVALVLLFAADTALLGIVPLPGTATRFAELIAAGEASIADQSIPAAADEGIRFLLASGIAGLAILADTTATLSRRPAAAAIPLLAILAVPIILAPGTLPVLSILATAAAFLLLLALHRPAASGGAAAAGRAVAVAAGVLVTALIVPPLLPPVIAGAGPAGSGLGGLVTGINPVLRLGDDLRRDAPVTALRYTTDAEGGVYLTVSHLADVGGATVEPVTDGVVIEGGAAESTTIGPPTWLGATVATSTVVTSIQLENLRSRWVPLPTTPISVRGLAGAWVLNADGVTMGTVESSLREGQYEVQSLVAAPTPEQLRGAGTDAPGLERFRALPDDLDPIIAEAAAIVAAAAEGDSAYDRALALQRFFTGGDFVYSEDAPVEGGFDGSGSEIIAQFLEVRAGYCVHYATAMTIMARTLGIPARIAVGFLPGARDPEAPRVYLVSTDDLHAWPELHFDGIGWVRFEPTPSRGSIPAYAAADVPAPSATLEVDPATGELVTPTPSPSSDQAADDDSAAGSGGDSASPRADEIAALDDLLSGGRGGDGGDGTAGAAATGGLDARPIAFALLVLLVLLLLAPSVWRVLRRYRRQRSPDPVDRWREVRDTARDLRLPAAATSTPRQLERAWAVDSPDLERLRAAVETRAYAPPGAPTGTAPPTTDPAAPPIDAVLHALRTSAPWWARILAVVAPLSLLDRAPDDVLPDDVLPGDVMPGDVMPGDVLPVATQPADPTALG